jgi:hypothetical protein
MTRGNIVNLLFGLDNYKENVILEANGMAIVEFVINECDLGKAEVKMWRNLLKDRQVHEIIRGLINQGLARIIKSYKYKDEALKNANVDPNA